MSSKVQISYLRKLENSETIGTLIKEMIDGITELDRIASQGSRWWNASMAFLLLGAALGLLFGVHPYRWFFLVWATFGPLVLMCLRHVSTSQAGLKHKSVVDRCTELTTDNPGEYRYLINEIKSATKDYQSGYKTSMRVGLFLFLLVLVSLASTFL